MDISVMRAAVCKMYPSPSWALRVKQMPAKQVVALYFKGREAAAKRTESAEYVQLALSDIINEGDCTK